MRSMGNIDNLIELRQSLQWCNTAHFVKPKCLSKQQEELKKNIKIWPPPVAGIGTGPPVLSSLRGLMGAGRAYLQVTSRTGRQSITR